MRITPCESTPRRLAQTTASAHGAAIVGATPAAAKIAAAKPVRSDLDRRMSLMATLICEASLPAQAGNPVHTTGAWGLQSRLTAPPRRTGSPAFAGDDGTWGRGSSASLRLDAGGAHHLGDA